MALNDSHLHPGAGLMKPRRAKPTTVLVVEDEPTVRVLAEAIIEALGYLILSAANAREAIALLEQEEHIDILFTDINLPRLIPLSQVGQYVV
jgi:CheY-like chemotaxis protein